MYVLSLQWPFTACVQNPSPPTQICRSPPPAFTIRGLWPTIYAPKNTIIPTCCFHTSTSLPFTLMNILDLTPALRRYWPDLTPTASDVSQWRLQWLLHGTCTSLSQRLYFRKVLQLARRYDFLRAFHAAGVIASGTRDHPVRSVQQAADAVVGGFHVGLRCLAPTAVSHRRAALRGHSSLSKSSVPSLLDALHICLSAPSFRVIDCPADLKLPRQITPDSPNAHDCDHDERLAIPYGSVGQLITPHGPQSNSSILPSQDTSSLVPVQLFFAVVYILVALLAIALVASFILYHCASRQLRHAQHNSYRPVPPSIAR